MDILKLVLPSYRGHMLHMKDGERTAQMFPGWIQNYQETNPGTVFTVHDQVSVGDRLWTRLSARRRDGFTANGMNQSRFDGELIAEEWAIWSSWIAPDLPY